MHKTCYYISTRATKLLKDLSASKKMLENTNEILTVRDLCSVLQIGRNTAYDLVNSGQLKCIRIKNCIRIPKQYLVEYIQQSSIQFNTG